MSVDWIPEPEEIGAVPATRTVNGHALSADVTVTKSDVGLGSVANSDTTTTANISDSSNKRFVSDAQLTVLGNTSGTNTGDQNLSSYVQNTRTISAGTGLTGGGDLSDDRSFAVSYGSSSGTACQGNDLRLSDARTPTAHTHAISEVTSLQASLDAKASLTGATFTGLCAVSVAVDPGSGNPLYTFAIPAGSSGATEYFRCTMGGTVMARIFASGRMQQVGVSLTANGDTTTCAVSRSNDTNTGMNWPSADTLDFVTGGTVRMEIDSTGQVGIGAVPASPFDVNANRIRVRTAKTPASASDTGAAGEICWDADHVYVCTATNTWKRVAIATW